MDGQPQADCITVMEIIRPLLLSPHSDQLAQDIATAIEAVCQMAKSDKMRQHALQEELARQSAKATAAEQACAAAEQARAQLEAKLKQLETTREASAADKARLQWYERELVVQTDRAEAALQERGALEDRIRLLESAQEQQTSRHDEERAALAHKWQQERARLQRKLEHWNFEVLAQQREVNRLRQQLQQQGRMTAAGADPIMSGGGRPEPRLTNHSAGYTSLPSPYSRSAADDNTPYIPAYHPQPGDPSNCPDSVQTSPMSYTSRGLGSSLKQQQQQQQYYEAATAPRHGVTPHYEAHGGFAAPGPPVLQHTRHGVVMGEAAGQARTPRVAGATPFSHKQQQGNHPQAAQYTVAELQQANTGCPDSVTYSRSSEHHQQAEQLPPWSPRTAHYTAGDQTPRSLPNNSAPPQAATAAVPQSAVASAAAAGYDPRAAQDGSMPQQRNSGKVSAKHNDELQAFLTAAAAAAGTRDTREYGVWGVGGGECTLNDLNTSSAATGMLHPPPIPSPQTPRPKVDAGRYNSSGCAAPYPVTQGLGNLSWAGAEPGVRGGQDSCDGGYYNNSSRNGAEAGPGVTQAQQCGMLHGQREATKCTEQQHAEQQGHYQPSRGYSAHSSRCACCNDRSSYAESNVSASVQQYNSSYRTRDSVESSPSPGPHPAAAGCNGGASTAAAAAAVAAAMQQSMSRSAGAHRQMHQQHSGAQAECTLDGRYSPNTPYCQY